VCNINEGIRSASDVDSALTLSVESSDPLKPVPGMTYIVFGGKLNLNFYCDCDLVIGATRIFTA